MQREGAVSGRRGGFTLVELMIVIAILLLLTLFVVSIFSANAGSDRMRSAARVAQSAFLGARDRALHAKEVRGVRLVRDETDPTLVTSFVYLQPMASLRYGIPVGGDPIQIEYIDSDGDGIADAPRLVRGFDVDWHDLDASGALSYPKRMQIPAGSGSWYTFTNVQLVPGTTPQEVTVDLLSDYLGPEVPPPATIAVPPTSSNASCEIALATELLPMHQPVPLPSGVVIDLDASGPTLNALWPAAPTPTNIDILFSPRGAVTGTVVASGPIHLLLNDISDASQDLNPIDPANKGEKLVLTVFPATGNVATFPIDSTDAVDNATGAAGPDGLADDLFRYARIGSVAGQ